MKRSGTFALTLLLILLQVIAALGSSAAMLVFARFMGPETFGEAMFWVSALLIASVFLSLNIEGAAMRFMLQGSQQDRAGYLLAGRRIIGAMWCLILGIGLISVCILGNPFQTIPPLIVCLIPPVLALNRLTARQGASLQKIKSATLPRLLSRPLVFSIAAGAFWISDLAPSVHDILALLLLSAAAALLIQTLLLRTTFGALQAHGRTRYRPEWVRSGLLLLPSLIFLEFFRDLILTSAATGLQDQEIGILAAALSLIALPGFALIAAEVVFSPKISRAYAANDPHRRDTLIKIAAITRIAGFGTCTLALLLVSDPVITFLGPKFSEALDLLYILLIIPLSRALCGNPVLILTLAGENKTVFKITLIALLGMTSLIIATSQFFGLISVGLIAAIGYAVLQISLRSAAIARTGIDPSGIPAIFKSRTLRGLVHKVHNQAHKALPTAPAALK